MSRTYIDTICAAFPGAVAADPTSELDSWKVGGKMFACFGERIDGVCVKTDSTATAAMLIDAGVGQKAPYFHASWVLLPFATDNAELQHRLKSSYDLIFASLTRKARDAITAQA